MQGDYAKNIWAAVKQALLDPVNHIDDCQLLFACACGTMLGFQCNKVWCCWLLNYFVVVVSFENSSDAAVLCSVFLQQEHYSLCFTDFVKGFYDKNHPTMPGMLYFELEGYLVTKGNKIKCSAPTRFDTRNVRCLVNNPNDVLRCVVLRTQIKISFIATRAIMSSLTSRAAFLAVVVSRWTQHTELGQTLLAR
jgi:hypothetical protein